MTSSSTRRSCLPSVLLLVMLVACIGVILFSFAASPASAAFFPAPTSTQENLWGSMTLPKPTYTATAVSVNTAVPVVTAIPVMPATEIPTIAPALSEAPAQLNMEMVDTFSAQVSSESQAPAPSYGGSKLILVDISE